MQTRRFQLDLTEQEHLEMERLAAHAGIKTKGEFVSSALTLFRWAANEIANGRCVASMDAEGGSIKQLEMPCLQAFARLRAELDLLAPGAEELRVRAKKSGLSAEKILAEMKQLLEAQHAGSNVHDGSAKPVSEAV